MKTAERTTCFICGKDAYRYPDYEDNFYHNDMVFTKDDADIVENEKPVIFCAGSYCGKGLTKKEYYEREPRAVEAHTKNVLVGHSEDVDILSTKYISWETYFMSLVYLTAMKSKDESSKIGAIIVGENREIISTGFNGICRHVKDSVEKLDIESFPNRNQRPEKYFWFEHAERNAIYNAARNGHRLLNSRMFTQGIPCSDCSRGIIQSGIKEVTYHKDWQDKIVHKNLESSSLWKNHSRRSIQMFKEAGVILRDFSGPIISNIFGRSSETDLKFNDEGYLRRF